MSFSTFHILSADSDISTGRARFHYAFDDGTVRFTEEVDFSSLGAEALSRMGRPGWLRVLAHVAIALGISYYKLSPTKTISVDHCYLDTEACVFWSDFYRHGLGEYLYRNGIDPTGLFTVVSTGPDIGRIDDEELSDRVLIPIGGGKDSCVSVELCREAGMEFDCFTFGKDYTLHRAVADVIGGRHIVVLRTISPELLRLNATGQYYNGHVPITGMIAFVLVAVAYLGGYRSLILSNERSANEGNTLWHGLEINHQYSKSLDFERDFMGYVSRTMGSGVRYFSLLRGMYEIDIAQRFAQYPQYFDVFSSCNANFKIIETTHALRDRWCRTCPKCAFVYAMVRPFVSSIDALRIFGADLYDDPDLGETYTELLGITGIKPFECVGTPEEVRLAMALACRRYTEEGLPLPILLQKYGNSLDSTDMEKLSQELMAGDGETLIPDDIRERIFA